MHKIEIEGNFSDSMPLDEPRRVPVNSTQITYNQFPTPYIEEGISYKLYSEEGVEPRIDLYTAGCTRGRTEWRFDGVFSPFWRLYYSPSHGNVVIHDKREYRLKGDNLLIIPRDVLFHCASTEDPNHLFVHFSYGGHGMQLISTPVSVKVTGLLEQQGKQLCHLLRNPDVEKRASYHRVLSFLHLAIAELQIETFSYQEQRIRRVLQHIESHYGQRIDNSSLAALTGLSPDYFVTWFRRNVGVSPNQYILTLRIRKAARRLVHTDKTIDMIADDVGFSSRHYFSRAFTGRMGISPAAFRKKWARSSAVNPNP